MYDVYQGMGGKGGVLLLSVKQAWCRPQVGSNPTPSTINVLYH